MRRAVPPRTSPFLYCAPSPSDTLALRIADPADPGAIADPKGRQRILSAVCMHQIAGGCGPTKYLDMILARFVNWHQSKSLQEPPSELRCVCCRGRPFDRSDSDSGLRGCTPLSDACARLQLSDSKFVAIVRHSSLLLLKRLMPLQQPALRERRRWQRGAEMALLAREQYATVHSGHVRLRGSGP